MKDERKKNGPEVEPDGSESVDVEENRTDRNLEEKEVTGMIKWALVEECPEVPDREGLLEEVFEAAKKPDGDVWVDDANADEIKAASFLGDFCDTMICGYGGEPAVSGEQRELVSVCRMIHSSFTESNLGEVRQRALFKSFFDATGAGAGVAGNRARAGRVSDVGRKSVHTGGWAVGGLALAAGLAALVWTWSTRRFDDPASRGVLSKERTASRYMQVAKMIPGPFPSDQTSTDRIDLLYGERLSVYRHDLISAVRGGKADTTAIGLRKNSGPETMPVRSCLFALIPWKR